MSHVHFSDLNQLKYLTQIDLLYKTGDCTWWVYDYEELVGVTHWR